VYFISYTDGSNNRCILGAIMFPSMFLPKVGLMPRSIRYKYTHKGVFEKKSGREIRDPSILAIVKFLSPLKPYGTFKLRPDGLVVTKVMVSGDWVPVEFRIDEVDQPGAKVQDYIIQ